MSPGWLGVPIIFVINGDCIATASDSLIRKPYAVKLFFPPVSPHLPAVLDVHGPRYPVVVGHSRGGAFHAFSDDIHPIAQPQSLSPAQWVGNLTLTETWRSNVRGGSKLFLAGHAWPLCYEEQFYAVCGLPLLCIPRHFYAGIVAITVLALVVIALDFALGASCPSAGFSLMGDGCCSPPASPFSTG